MRQVQWRTQWKWNPTLLCIDEPVSPLTDSISDTHPHSLSSPTSYPSLSRSLSLFLSLYVPFPLPSSPPQR